MSKKSRLRDRYATMSDNEIAGELRLKGSGFLLSPEWRALRARVVAHYGGKCMKCSHIPKRGVNVDHIKPRKLFPELALEFDNLQVLCSRCNKAKGNKHQTDYRRLSTLAAAIPAREAA